MEERYLPKTSSQFLLLFLLILLVIFQIPHSHGHKQRDNTISCVFDGGWFWVMCVCELCKFRKKIYLSKFTYDITSCLRFVREPLDLLWVFCDLCVEKEMLPAAFTGSL